MEFNDILNIYLDFIKSNYDALPVFIGQTPDASSSHINIYPVSFNFSYERDNYSIALEIALPETEIKDAIVYADDVAKVIEIDNLDECRLSTYAVEFYWNAQIAGTVIVFEINLFTERCR